MATFDTFGIAMCDNDLCEEKKNCKRYKDQFLAEYDFAEVSKTWDCLIRKEQNERKTN